MISCYELRIGNYVLVDGTVQKVSMVSTTAVLSSEVAKGVEENITEHRLNDVEPLLLTDEVLKQCGFAFHDYFNFWQLITTGIRSEMDVDVDYNVIDFMRRPFIWKLTALHQLQNSYFLLKGRELEYRQPALIKEDAVV